MSNTIVSIVSGSWKHAMRIAIVSIVSGSWKHAPRSIVPAILILSLLVCSSCKHKRPRGPWVTDVTMVEPAAPATDVQQYSKLELVIKIDHAWIVNPYDADPTTGGIDIQAFFVGPSGSYWVPAFWDGTDFRARFTPMTPGYWEYSVKATDANGTGGWSLGKFTCSASGKAGFARIDGRYLRTSNGQTLFPLGHNNGWQIDVEQPSLANMAAAGENLLSFWQTTPWIHESDAEGRRAPLENIESGVGNYNLKACTYLDGLVTRADAAGVFLQPALWSHGELRIPGVPWPEGWWDNNAYSAICATPTEFFRRSQAGAETPQWHHQKNFLRYVYARWGYSPAILNWIAVVEVNGTTCYTTEPTLITDWLQGVQAEFNKYDCYRNRGGSQSPIAAFATDDETFEPGISMRSVDTYRANGQETLPSPFGDNYNIAFLIASQTFTMRATPKPCFHGEFGADLHYGTATQPLHGHNGIWSGVASGAAMTPLLWCDNGNFPLLNNGAAGGLQAHYTLMKQFLNGISYLGDPTLVSQPLNPAVGSVTRLSNQGFGWAPYIPIAADFSVTGLEAGMYSVAWYNVWTSGTSPVFTESVATNAGALELSYPPSLRAATFDLAFRFTRVGAGGTAEGEESEPKAPATIEPTSEGSDAAEPLDTLPPSGPSGEEDPPPESGDTSGF